MAMIEEDIPYQPIPPYGLTAKETWKWKQDNWHSTSRLMVNLYTGQIAGRFPPARKHAPPKPPPAPQGDTYCEFYGWYWAYADEDAAVNWQDAYEKIDESVVKLRPYLPEDWPDFSNKYINTEELFHKHQPIDLAHDPYVVYLVRISWQYYIGITHRKHWETPKDAMYRREGQHLSGKGGAPDLHDAIQLAKAEDVRIKFKVLIDTVEGIWRAMAIESSLIDLDDPACLNMVPSDLKVYKQDSKSWGSFLKRVEDADELDLEFLNKWIDSHQPYSSYENKHIRPEHIPF